MSLFSGGSKQIKGGLVVLDVVGCVLKLTIALRYIPDSLSRSLLRNQG